MKPWGSDPDERPKRSIWIEAAVAGVLLISICALLFQAVAPLLQQAAAFMKELAA